LVGGFTEAAWKNATEISQGGDQPHNNMQPYIVVGRWVRTA
jgi:microcystin-dependent protein